MVRNGFTNSCILETNPLVFPHKILLIVFIYALNIKCLLFKVKIHDFNNCYKKNLVRAMMCDEYKRFNQGQPNNKHTSVERK